jgi:DNA topoisomerase-1
MEVLKEKKILSKLDVKRVVFHEITKTAIQHAFDTPKDLDKSLVEAYLARRVLDYLVGFSLSPVLWRKMPGARSAGRVQSVALRIIVERELEIQAFKAEEYWSIHGVFQAEKDHFQANLVCYDSQKLDKLDIKNEEEATHIKDQLLQKQYHVEKIERKSVKRGPYAPFTTSTLQQDAVRKLGFSAKKTMQVAQKLYEGIAIAGTMSGLITYMRTDSTALSNDAVQAARALILQDYGEKYLPKSPKVYKTKAKNAQEAHEAIRPTFFDKKPLDIKDFLSEDEFKLYDLIWKRAFSSQMADAIIDQVSVSIVSDDKVGIFKATGSSIAFDGFLKIYNESSDEDDEKKAKKLPPLNEKEDLKTIDIIGEQHFTQPPPRFNEASLVKKLEELGIGRPSTYASIINVLQERKYVLLQKKTFVPESIGYLTTSFLRQFFGKYVQYGFTADLEDDLDKISNGAIYWENVLNDFWQEFDMNIKEAGKLSITDVINSVEKDIENFIFKDIDETRKCPLCKDGDIHLKLGKYGAFLGCSVYPECKFTKKIGSTQTGGEAVSLEPTNKEKGTDPRTNELIFLKNGPYGFYFEWEKTKKEKKPKRLTVPKFAAAPESISIEDIIKLDSLPRKIAIHKETGEEILLCIGKFGPFLKLGKTSFRLEKTMDFLNLSEPEAIQICAKQKKKTSKNSKKTGNKEE